MSQSSLIDTDPHAQADGSVNIGGDAEALAAQVVAETAGTAFASQWQLMWWRFLKHRAAVVSGIILLVIYTAALVAEFVSPSSPEMVNSRYTFAPPQAIHLFYRDAEGALRFEPYVYDYKVELDRRSMRRTFAIDETKRIPIGLFVKSQPYELFGLIPMEHRLIGPVEVGRPFYLLGADRLGGDVLTRIIHGSRVSLSIGLFGVLVTLVIGILVGGISGFYGGAIDQVLQRFIEFIRALPSVPLWLGMAAAVPKDWSPLLVYFVITAIVSLIGWTDLGRQVRSLCMSIKNEDFVLAARLDGASDLRIIVRHLVPAFTSHIIATATLAVPMMIMAETGLSFLGIGLKPPVVSWGVLLQEAQNMRAVANAPWLLFPGGAVVIAVLAFNFLGDGLRDAADPYSQEVL